MIRKTIRAGRSLPVVGLLALLLTLGVLVTTPLTMSKYMAFAAAPTGVASVASWAPDVDLSRQGDWTKTVLMISNKSSTVASEEWVFFNQEDQRFNYNRDGTPAYHSYHLKPDNSGSQVATNFDYAVKMMKYGAEVDCVANWGLYVDSRPDIVWLPYVKNDNNNTPNTPVAPLTAGDRFWRLYVYINKGTRPYDELNCYARCKFVWTATQAD